MIPVVMGHPSRFGPSFTLIGEGMLRKVMLYLGPALAAVSTDGTSLFFLSWFPHDLTSQSAPRHVLVNDRHERLASTFSALKSFVGSW